MLTIPAVTLLEVVGVKHQYRPATDEELRAYRQIWGTSVVCKRASMRHPGPPGGRR